MNRVAISLAVLASAFSVSAASAVPIVYNNANNANVLRQYNPAGQNRVSQTIAGTNVQTSPQSNDGTGLPDQWFLPNPGEQGVSTYTLPAPRTVGSYQTSFNGSHLPSVYLLEGLTTSGWVTLANARADVNRVNFSGGPQTVTQIRYTVTGPGSPYVQNSETAVYLATGQPATYDDGYSLLRDATSSTTTSITNTPTPNKWRAPGSGSAGNLIDGNYFGGHMHAQLTTTAPNAGAVTAPDSNTIRAFVTYSLAGPTDMTMGRIGWYQDQKWDAWEVYTSDAVVMPATQTLADASPSTIQAAGWTLQFARVGYDQARLFNFTNGYVHRHILLAFNGGGAAVEFEVFAPEPTTMAMILVGTGLLLARGRRKQRVV